MKKANSFVSAAQNQGVKSNKAKKRGGYKALTII